MFNVCKEETKVLVIAPNFPAINQPWMDTYLEQLLIFGMPFKIFTKNGNSKVYQQKVDDLSLRDHQMEFSLFSLMGFLRLTARPVQFLKSITKHSALAKEFSGFGIGYFSSLCKIVFFSGHEKTFHGITLIHSHSEILAFEFSYLASLKVIPLIVTFHGLPPSGVDQLDPKKRKLLYSVAKKVIVNTKFARNQVVSLGCASEKIEILPQGLTLEDFDYLPRRAPDRDQLLELLTVGRYQKDKGQAYVLLALRRLVNSGALVHYHLVGVGDEGRRRLEKIVSSLHLSGHVTFHQDLSSDCLKDLYHQCHLFILPSLSSKDKSHEETQGVVLQEAQASGCIPIATRVGGIPECVNDQLDSILVNDRSSRAIYSAVTYLMDNVGMWGLLQKGGRENVENNFAAERIGYRMNKILKNSSERTLLR